MGYLLNLDFDRKSNTNNLLIHLRFLSLWLLIISVLIARIDVFLISMFYNNTQWIFFYSFPIICIILFLSLRSLKWYYIVAFIFYIPLVIFWFLPKFILREGKMYVLISYIKFIITRFTKWKSTFFHLLLASTLVFALIYVSEPFMRLPIIVILCYFLFKFWFKYAEYNLNPIGILGNDVIEFREVLAEDESKTFEQYDKILERQNKTKKSEKEIKMAHVKEIIQTQTLYSEIASNLSLSKSKKYFVLYWMFLFMLSICFSLFIISLLNYQLYLFDNSNFIVEEGVNYIDFLKYSVKSLVYSDTEQVKPSTNIANIVEFLSFFVNGIIHLMILIGFGYNFHENKLNEDITLIIQFFNKEAETSNNYIVTKYGNNIEDIALEVAEIKKSIRNIVNLII